MKTLPGRFRPPREGLLTELVIGPKHVVGLWEDQDCPGPDACSGLYITGIASGRQQKLDDDAGAVCYNLLSELRFDGRAFRWTREVTAVDSGDTSVAPRSSVCATTPRPVARP